MFSLYFSGTVGTYPRCEQPKCPIGTIGTFPNCVTPPKPTKEFNGYEYLPPQIPFNF